MKRHMLMFAPDAAIADAPADTSQPATTNVGEKAGALFNKIMAGEKPAEATPAPEVTTEATPKPETQKKPEPPTKKPTSAVDALLSKPAKPADETPSDDDPLKEFPTDAKEKNFAALRKKAEEGWKRAKELESKLATPDPKLNEELESLRATVTERESKLKEYDARMAEYKEAMTAVNIELDPDYRREFIDGRKRLVETASSKFKAYGGEPEAFAEALALPEGRRRDEVLETLMESLSDTAKSKVLRTIQDVDSLDEKRAEILKAPQQSFEAIERRRAAEHEEHAQQTAAFIKKEFGRISQSLAASLPTLGLADETLEGGKAWNEARRANDAAALELLGPNATREQYITASIKSSDYDRVVTLLMDARKTLAEQAEQLAEYNGAQPDVRGRTGPKPTPQQERAGKTAGAVFTEQMRTARSQDDF